MSRSGGPRFVVLHHLPGKNLQRDPHGDAVGAHWDWMFEMDGVLKTWATSAADIDKSNPFRQLTLKADQLVDHRLHYLQFEGDISGDRGTVHQVFKGTYDLLSLADHAFTANLQWVDNGHRRTASVDIQRNLTSICLSDETRAVWELRFLLER